MAVGGTLGSLIPPSLLFVLYAIFTEQSVSALQTVLEPLKNSVDRVWQLERARAKLYRDRYKLERFGTGFMRLALATGSPVVPFAFIGGEEAHPTVFHLERIANLVGAPYIPVPPWLLPIPIPVHCEIWYGEPMTFEGDGTEADEVIEGYVEQVKDRIRSLIEQGRRERGSLFGTVGGELTFEQGEESS